MKLKSELRILAIILATVLLSAFLLSVGSCNKMAYGQAATAQQFAPYVELGAVWDDASRTIADAQWTWGSLEGQIAMLQAKKPMSDADRKLMNDNINKANTIISQWGSKKQDLMSRLSRIQTQLGTTSMSSGDTIKASGDVRAIQKLIEQGDHVMADLKNTVDQVNKYK
jgi:uncharacterized protein (UPF0333 family)